MPAVRRRRPFTRLAPREGPRSRRPAPCFTPLSTPFCSRIVFWRPTGSQKPRVSSPRRCYAFATFACGNQCPDTHAFGEPRHGSVRPGAACGGAGTGSAGQRRRVSASPSRRRPMRVVLRAGRLSGPPESRRPRLVHSGEVAPMSRGGRLPTPRRSPCSSEGEPPCPLVRRER